MREYLVYLRKQHDESQQKVANALGITRQYYQQIERGKRQQKMDIVLMAKLAEHFHISISVVASKEQNFRKTIANKSDLKSSKDKTQGNIAIKKKLYNEKGQTT